jgi:Flp pilus assembly protein TadD
LAPANPQILFNLIRAELRGDQKSLAAQQAKVLLRFPNTDAALAVRLGKELAQYELYAEAASAYEHALSLKIDSSEIYYDLSFSYFRTNRFRESAAMLERLTDLRQHNSAYFTLLGLSYAEIDNSGRAVSYLRQALQLEPHNPDYIYNLGITLVRTGQTREALALFQDAAHEFSDLAPIQYGLGAASFHLGMNQEARQYFTNAIQLDASNSEYHSSLGDVYGAAGEYELLRSLMLVPSTLLPPTRPIT